MSFGDPRYQWNDHVVEHLAPLLAACASKARLDDKTIECPLSIYPSREVTNLFYADVTLTDVPPEKHLDPAADR